MKEVSQYIKYRIGRLKKTDGLITLSHFIIGLAIATWKFGIKPTALSVFIFFSGLVFAEFLSTPKLYFFNNQKRSELDKGRQIFTLILLTTIVILQFFLWDKFVTICSLGVGITFGLIMMVVLKFW